MRLTVDVREGDWTRVSYSAYGTRFSRKLDTLIEEGRFDPSDGTGRWSEVDRLVGSGFFEVDVPDADLPRMTVGELKMLCLTEARRIGAARPGPDPRLQTPATESDRFSALLSGVYDEIFGVWLSDPVLDERLDDQQGLLELDLTDGDLLVLSIEHPAEAGYMMAAPPNPEELLRWLQLAENATAPAAGPRLWGVLLYTDADVELATYVRTYFDDLNVLSGPATRVFVVERRRDWSTAKKYWRRHMEPELYRVMSAMRWLRWTPYDPQGAYEIASLLGLGHEQLPCLVLFHSRQGPLQDGDKLVFPIEHTSTAYFRALFGGIATALRPVSGSTRPPGDGDGHRSRLAESRTSEYFRYYAASRESKEYAPAAEAVRNLLSSARTTDAAAFEAVRAAQDTIRSAMRAAVPPPAGITVSNSQVVLDTTGAAMSENFYFQGENTTFINRPQDTVIRDFQNAHGTALGADQLTELLRLVLSSGDMSAADREEAAGTIDELARLGSGTAPDRVVAGTRLERLRALLSSSADIAQPALAILSSLTAFFAG